MSLSLLYWWDRCYSVRSEEKMLLASGSAVSYSEPQKPGVFALGFYLEAGSPGPGWKEGMVFYVGALPVMSSSYPDFLTTLPAL